MTEAYPLKWPQGWLRTKEQDRQRARFSHQNWNESFKRQVTFQEATTELYNELSLLRAKNIVLSSNLNLKNNGIPYSSQKADDPGIAVYFIKNGKEQCIPCDKWLRAEDNIKAIAKTINAIRGIERWGAKNMVDAAFRGFVALPSPENVISRTSREIIGVAQDMVDLDYITFKYKQRAKELHPDNGGDTKAFQELNSAYEDLKRELK